MKTMRKRMSQLFGLVAVGTALMAGVSCSNDTEELMGQPGVTEETEHTAVMHLTGGLQSYTPKRETSAEWNEGDVIYLRFYQADEKTVVCGKAVYNASSSLWNISYYGNLATGSTLKCEAFYFVNATATDNLHVAMTPMSCVYADEEATYIVDGGELFVSAVLTPKTARMRVKGEAGKKVAVSGLLSYQTFSLTDKEFATAAEKVSMNFSEDGYTPYIYGSLGEMNELTLDDEYYHYTKAFDPGMFTAGASGFVTMPTQEVNKGWAFEYYYPKEAVDLGLSVRWASMNVGASDEFDDGTYCSWGDAYGTNISTDSYNGNVHEIAGNPAYDIATREWGERWQIPTKEQWQELIDGCTWKRSLNSELDVYVWNITGPNGNSINLPVYEYIRGDEKPSTSSSNYGYYWSSTEYDNSSSTTSAYNMYLYSTTSKKINNEPKYYRMPVRPVLVK